MKKERNKTTVIINILAVLFLFCTSSLAQSSPTRLTLNTPLNAEIKGEEINSYSVALTAGQTARVEMVQDGIDVNFEAIDLKGEIFIIGTSPSGLYGDELILVTAKESGDYRIDVSVSDPAAKPGKYTVILKEIRPTVAEDFEVNDATKRILQLARDAYQIKYNGTIEGLRGANAKWDEVIAASKIKKDKVWEGVAIVQQGLIYKQLGELQNALDSYLKSLEIWRELGNRQYEGSAVNNIGSAYSDLGEYEKSLTYFQQSANINREVGDRVYLGFSLTNLAEAYSRLGDFTKAEDYFKQSLVIRREDTTERGKRTLAGTIKNYGYMLATKGEAKNGLALIQESLDLRREIGYSWGIADSLLAIGNLKAENRFENYTEANRIALEVGDRRLQAESFYLLAVAEQDRGNLTKAVENITNGLDLIEQIRSEIVGSESRYAYFSTVQNYYELYTELLVSRFERTKKEEDLALAFEISERSRSRSLVELLEEAKVDFKLGVDPKLLAEQKNLQKQINDRYQRRETLIAGKSKPEPISKVNDEINELNTKIQNVNIRLRRENPKFADLAEGKAIAANDIQKLLDDDTILLEYKLGEKRSFLWLVAKDSIEIFELPKRQIIETKARAFYDSVVANSKGQPARTEQVTKDLSRMLLSNVAAKVANKRLAIVADGVLQYIPFSALISPQSEVSPLVETNEIVMLPSASVLSQLRDNPKPGRENKKTIAIFADPVFDLLDSRVAGTASRKPSDENTAMRRTLRDFRFGETLPRLLASRLEAKGISSLIEKSDAEVRMDFEANLDNVENSNLKDYRILHFATHGLLNSSRPELSGLVFSLFDKNGTKQNGFLTLNDIYNLDLSSDLIVLSACQTALGKDIRGEGLIGMSRGFLYAGSKRIVASLWKVDDSATAEFMKRFYTNHLRKAMPASKALQQTKNEMKKIRRYQSPYYWSAFTLLGDWQ
ncbi:MAG: CHAT domain-containing protein [Acidobacteria bacterium]|nr:CHAT domain-containing protein [Acidobacteriota bacterium]